MTKKSLIIIALLLSSAGARAAIPTTLNYQGRMRNLSGGAPVADSTANSATFRLYTVLTGGSPVWSETQTSVTTTSGLFNVVLGSANPLNVPFDQQYYLEVVWNSITEVMSPRTALTAGPYAFRAKSLELPFAGTTGTGTIALSVTAGSGAASGAYYGRNNSTNPTAEFINDGLGTPLKVNALSFPTGVGANGQVLTTDGSSQMSWAPAPSPAAPVNLTSTGTASALAAFNSGGGAGVFGQSSLAGGYGIYGKGSVAGAPAIQADGTDVGLSATASNGVAIYGRNNGGGGFKPTALFEAGGTNHGLEARNTFTGSFATLAGDLTAGQTAVYGRTTAGLAKGVWGDNAVGYGIYGNGMTGVAGVVTTTGQLGVLADSGGFVGSSALRVIGPAQFSAGTVTFTSHIDFSGSTITGWNVPATVVAPVNLTSTGAASALSAFNTFGGTAVFAQSSVAGGQALYGKATVAGTKAVVAEGFDTGISVTASDLTTGSALYGRVNSGQPSVRGLNDGAGIGVFGSSASGSGVQGSSTSSAGGQFIGSTGVLASGSTMGVSATANAATGQALYGRVNSTSAAAEFVNDNVAGSPLKINNMKFPGTDFGLGGKFLGTDGAGNLTWTAATISAPLSLTSTNGAVPAIYATNSANGTAVYVSVSANSSNAVTVINSATSSPVYGLAGITPFFAGVKAGLVGSTENGFPFAPVSSGVYGYSSTSAGVSGLIDAPANSGKGVYGKNVGTANIGAGVYGENVSGPGAGIIAYNSSAGGIAVALSATTLSASGKAIYASNSSTAATAEFINNNTNGSPLKLNNMKFPSTDTGFGGSMLSTDGAGNLTWTAIGGTLFGGTVNSVPYFTSAVSLGNSGMNWDNTNLRLGLGIPAAPAVTLHVGNASAASTIFNDAAGGGFGSFTGRGARGTLAAPSGALSGDTLASFGGRGYGTTTYSTDRSFIRMRTSEAWTDAVQGSNMGFFTTGLGSTLPNERMTLDAAGNLGIGATSPGSSLDLNGAMSFRGMAAPTNAPGTQGRIYFDSATNKFKMSENGGAYVNLDAVTAPLSLSSSAANVSTLNVYNNSGNSSALYVAGTSAGTTPAAEINNNNTNQMALRATGGFSSGGIGVQGIGAIGVYGLNAGNGTDALWGMAQTGAGARGLVAQGVAAGVSASALGSNAYGVYASTTQATGAALRADAPIGTAAFRLGGSASIDSATNTITMNSYVNFAAGSNALAVPLVLTGTVAFPGGVLTVTNNGDGSAVVGYATTPGGFSGGGAPTFASAVSSGIKGYTNVTNSAGVAGFSQITLTSGLGVIGLGYTGVGGYARTDVPGSRGGDFSSDSLNGIGVSANAQTGTAGTFNGVTGVVISGSQMGLIVSGGARINSLTYPTSDGTSGQVLKTDGSGNLSFGPGGGVSAPMSLTSVTAVTALNVANTVGGEAIYASASTSSYGIESQNSGSGPAVAGINSSSGGTGVFGFITTPSNSGNGVIGQNQGGANTGAGVKGINSSGGGIGVYGVNTAGKAMVAEGTTLGLSVSATSGKAIYAVGAPGFPSSLVELVSNGTGYGIYATKADPGSSSGAVIYAENSASTSGYAIDANINNASNQSAAINASVSSGHPLAAGIKANFGPSAGGVGLVNGAGIVAMNDQANGIGVYAKATHTAGSKALVAQGGSLGLSATASSGPSIIAQGLGAGFYSRYDAGSGTAYGVTISSRNLGISGAMAVGLSVSASTAGDSGGPVGIIGIAVAGPSFNSSTGVRGIGGTQNTQGGTGVEGIGDGPGGIGIQGSASQGIGAYASGVTGATLVGTTLGLSVTGGAFYSSGKSVTFAGHVNFGGTVTGLSIAAPLNLTSSTVAAALHAYNGTGGIAMSVSGVGGGGALTVRNAGGGANSYGALVIANNGSASPRAGLVGSSSENFINPSGAVGVYGYSTNTAGVSGFMDAAGNVGAGVKGENAAGSGYGVLAVNSAVSGSMVALSASSSGGTAVYANTNSSAPTIVGLNAGSGPSGSFSGGTGNGAIGSTAGSGAAGVQWAGLKGQFMGGGTAEGFGIWGVASTANPSKMAGVYGEFGSPAMPSFITSGGGAGAGVAGVNGNAGAGIGVYGQALGTGGIAVLAKGGAVGLSATASGVWGMAVHASSSNSGAGSGTVVVNNTSAVGGNAIYASGVTGVAASGTSVGFVGTGGVAGVMGYTESSDVMGVYGYAGDPNSYAMVALNPNAGLTGGYPALSATAAADDGIAGYFQAVTGVVVVSSGLGISVTSKGGSSGAIFSRSSSTAATIRGINDNTSSASTGVLGLASGNGAGVKGQNNSGVTGNIGVWGQGSGAGGTGVYAANTAATAAGGGSALYVDGPVVLSGTDYFDSSTTGSPTGVGTITAAQGSIVFTAGTGKTIGIDGTYGPFTCTNLSPRSVVLVTFASATAAVYTAQAQVNLAGTQFTVKFRNTAAIGFALNDQMNFVILRK